MDTELVEEFERGVDDYYAGVLPDGWDAPDALRNPYLAGWNLAADAEHQQHFFSPDNDEPWCSSCHSNEHSANDCPRVESVV